MIFYQGDERDYNSSFGEGMWLSIKVSTALSFLFSLSIMLFGSNMPLLEFIGMIIVWFLFMSIATGFITLIFTLIIARPIVAILCYFNMANEVSVSISGGLIIFTLLMCVFAGEFMSLYYVFVFWGMACGYAFMSGFNRAKS